MKGTYQFLILFCLAFGAQAALAAPILPGSFSTTWQTDNTGLTGNNQIRFGLGSGGDGETCSGIIYWEEVGNDTNNGSSTLDGSCNYETITFPSPGTYRVDVLGSHPSFRMNYLLSGVADNEKLLTVEQWGDNVWSTFAYSFRIASNMTMNATDIPNLSAVTSMIGMFGGATSFNGDINNWDVSNVTNMSGLFSGATTFNQPLNNWNVSNVTDMTSMFAFATAFNQDISSWNVSSVTNFREMFRLASSFNQPLNSWNTASATSMLRMFWDATAFNQPLNSWNVSNVTEFGGVAPYGNVSMFTGATAFNQSLSNWNITSAANLRNFFSGATSFNQDISLWNVSGATDLREMFFGASAFNQDLGAWQIQDGVLMTNVFRDSGLTPQNYADILTAWSSLIPPATGIDLGIVSTTYCDTATAARTTLTDTYLWTITDLGPEVCVSDPTEATSTISTGGGQSGTVIGLRQKRLDDLKNAMSSSTASVSEKLTTFVASLKKFLSYLTTHEEEIKNLSPEESKAVIMVLRDAILELLKWLPGV